MYDIIKINEDHPSLESSLKRQFTENQRLLVDLIVDNGEQKQGASFASLAVRAGYGDETNVKLLAPLIQMPSRKLMFRTLLQNS